MGNFFSDSIGGQLFGGLTDGNLFEGNVEGQSIQQQGLQNAGQEQLLNQINQFLSGQVGKGVTAFKGTRPGEVPFSQFQNQGFASAGGLAPSIQQGFQRSNDFGQQAQGALSQGLQGFDPQRIMDALEPGRQLAENQFNQRTVPNLLERFGANSGSSGALNQAFADAGANLSLGLGAQAAPFLGQAALQAPGNQLQGAQLASNFGQQGFGQALQGLGQQFDIGALQRSLAQGRAAGNQSRFLESQAQNNPFLSQLGGLGLGTNAFENIAFQGFRDPSMFEKFAGPVAQGAGAFAALSDERFKEEIEPIEDALAKIEQIEGKTYHYKMNQSPTKNAGVIAQDAEKVIPEAVVEVDGVKIVDYIAIIGLAVNAIKELSAEVKELKRKVA